MRRIPPQPTYLGFDYAYVTNVRPYSGTSTVIGVALFINPDCTDLILIKYYPFALLISAPEEATHIN